MSIAKSPESDFKVDEDYDLSGLNGFPIFMTAGTEEVPYLKATERARDFFESQGADVTWHLTEGGTHKAVNPDLYFDLIMSTDQAAGNADDYGSLY